ncbi:MAG TPA: phosphatase [Hyphomonas adhaerens]|uniref:Phosphatase n=2 Tax=Hyphomonadaceae TaxID=69657 RepID=A0A3B9GT37_9PROT|nr:phosphatase [Hyphomonas sp.]HAE25607.1 phosphatase [Hyphomonas adhaerens]
MPGSMSATWLEMSPVAGKGQHMKTAIIGDVHGALGPLQALVAALDLCAGDRLVFVGDLVDKGPDSAGVVKFVRKLSETAPYEVILIEGNHEDRHRRYHINTAERPKVARTMAADAPELPALDAELSAGDRAFLATAVPFLHLPEWGALVVHGGIPGTHRSFPETVEQASLWHGRRAKAFRKILRTRYVSAETGEYLALGANQPDDPFWAEVYDGRFGHVIFGHQPWLDGPACFAHATGLDTAAVHGGSLTALVLPQTGAPYFKSVPGIDYAPRKTAEWPDHPGGALKLTRP